MAADATAQQTFLLPRNAIPIDIHQHESPCLGIKLLRVQNIRAVMCGLKALLVRKGNRRIPAVRRNGNNTPFVEWQPT